MPPLQLDGDLEIGIFLIDDEHRQLLALHDEIVDNVGRKDPPYATIEVLARLYRAAERHFDHEEAIMEQLGYPGLDAHRDAHRDLMQRLKDYVLRFRTDGDAINGDLAEFVRRWVTDHVADDDQEFGRWADERGIPEELRGTKMAPEEVLF